MDMNYTCKACGGKQRIKKYPETIMELECIDQKKNRCAIVDSVTLNVNNVEEMARARRLYEEQLESEKQTQFE